MVGAGLAGSEAAWTLARAGIPVDLLEMKPARRSPVQRLDGFAELVCSNSLRSDDPLNAVGLLHEELRRAGSLVLACADETRVPAGGALAVDREAFSALVTDRLSRAAARPRRAHRGRRAPPRTRPRHPGHRAAHLRPAGRRARRRWSGPGSPSTTPSRRW